MYPIPGHLSVSLILSRYLKLALIPCIAASLFPDVIDKALSDIFHITGFGRTVMHSLLGVGCCSLIICLIKNRKWGLSWAAGHTGHLIGDISYVPWFWPFIEREQVPEHVEVYNIENLSNMINLEWVVLETVLLLLSIIVIRKFIKNSYLETAIALLFIVVLVYRLP